MLSVTLSGLLIVAWVYLIAKGIRRKDWLGVLAGVGWGVVAFVPVAYGLGFFRGEYWRNAALMLSLGGLCSLLVSDHKGRKVPLLGFYLAQAFIALG